MRFPERDLQAFAVSVEPLDLKVGSAYFSVGFVDDKMLVPAMSSLVFLGSEPDDAGNAKFIFQDAASYFAETEGPGELECEPGELFECSVDELAGLYKFDEALNVLLRCALRHAGEPTA